MGIVRFGIGNPDALRMVPGPGIEPGRPRGRQILSLLRLPVPPSGLERVRSLRDDRAPAGQGLAAAPKKKPDLSVGLVFLEAWVGIEPAYADLQSAA